MSDPFSYIAFISYRRGREADRLCADWLVEALETFRTPPELARAGFPLELGTVFRDDNELTASADLGHAITQALYGSRHLVVICSEGTPHSLWMRAEISLFQFWGRADRILPVLIGDSPLQCYPPELMRWRLQGEGPAVIRELIEPAGANTVPLQGQSELEARALALDKIACRLLGCEFAVLRDRQVERRQRETEVAYFQTFVRCWGAPKGVGRLTQDQVRRRSFSYKVETRDGRVQRMERVNAHGLLAPDDDDTCQWDVSYRTNGRIEALDLRAKHGVVKTREVYSRDLTKVDFHRADDSAAARVEAMWSTRATPLSNPVSLAGAAAITRHVLTYDHNGFVTLRRYVANSTDQPAQDADGNWGYRYEVDGEGRVLRTAFVDSRGATSEGRRGIATEERVYEDSVDWVERRFYSSAGDAVLGDKLVHCMVRRYDSDGNRVEFKTYDVASRPCLDAEGVHHVVWHLDAHGQVAEQATFGVSGERVFWIPGMWSIRRMVYDARGNVIEERFYGTDAEPTCQAQGYSRASYEYDQSDDLICKRLFDLEGNATLCKDGYAAVKYAYDAVGNLIEEAFFGVDGESVHNWAGFSREATVYDDRGRILESAFFDAQNQPVSTRYGWAQLAFSYDSLDNVIGMSCLGVAGEPVLSYAGFSRVLIEFDLLGRFIRECFFGPDGRLVMNANGYTEARVTYEARGNLVEVAYFGLDGSPIRQRDGIARERRVYDPVTRTHEQSFWDVEGQPVLCSLGFAKMIRMLDGRGQVVEQACFGCEGQPIKQMAGYAVIKAAYDPRGNLREIALFGCDREPINHVLGAARVMYVNDSRGRSVETRYFDVDGQPALSQEGFARIVDEYDARGNLIVQTYFGITGEPVPNKAGVTKLLRRYDERSRLVEAINIPVSQELPLRITLKYDAPGSTVELACWGLDGVPRLDKTGSARAKARLDGWGNVREVEHYGIDGEPVLNRNGFHVVAATYDHEGRPVVMAFFGVEREPIALPKGFHIAVRSYEEAVQTHYLDLEGNRVEVLGDPFNLDPGIDDPWSEAVHFCFEIGIRGISADPFRSLTFA